MAQDKAFDPTATMSAIDTLQQQPSGAPKTNGRVDTVAMVEAWNLTGDALKRVVYQLTKNGEQMERNEQENARLRASNQRVQISMYVAAAALVASLGWIHHLGVQSAARDDKITSLIEAGALRLANVEVTLKLVAASVAAEVDASSVAAEVDEVPTPPAARPRRRSRAQDAALAEAEARRAQKRRQARHSRIVARAHAAKAQVHLAEGAAEKAKAATKMKRVKADGRAAGLDISSF